MIIEPLRSLRLIYKGCWLFLNKIQEHNNNRLFIIMTPHLVRAQGAYKGLQMCAVITYTDTHTGCKEFMSLCLHSQVTAEIDYLFLGLS